jgi:DNA-binding transcriptional regulator YiaG
MPNIATLLKAEITRVSRREIKKELAAVRKANVTYRHHIAALKRQVAELGHKSAQLAKRAQATSNEPAVMSTRPVRFVAKGFAAMRKRLGLSAAQLGRLVGASEQSVYNWETKKAVPRKEALAAIVELRGMGKREAQLRLSVKPKAPTTKRAKVKRK